MSYATQHASALASVTEKGVALSCSVVGFGSVATATVAGYATDAGAGRRVYVDGQLVQSANPRVLFVASTYGECPAVGAGCTWSGAPHTIKTVEPYAPDGVVLFAYLELVR